ncbi:MAG: DUF1015 domain-containing protein [Firmicutes bacterium HGW-Firmicutes-13]|nr:MAG: DUF1015 domain-containing protein [Firmicutes bacterium HGW-Firmicutes-13]
MAEIIPFRGIRFNLNIIDNLSELITPPYDVINEQNQKLFYEKNPYNIIRLEYGQTFAEDNEENNVYTRAASEFNRWIEEEILIRDKQPSLYLYELGFSLGGKEYVRKGFFACVKLEEFKKRVVLPHEETLSKPKEDRLKLLRTCKTNFSPIFGLYDDKNFIVEEIFKTVQDKPDLNFRDEEGNTHKIWVVSESSTIERIKNLLKNLQIFIADGHHRYETALEFSREMKQKGFSGYNFVLMGLVNLHNPGLIVLPTNRLVKNLKNFKLQNFLEKLGQDFNITEFPFNRETREKVFQKLLELLKERGLNNHAYGLYGGNNCFYLITLKNKDAMDRINMPHSKDWKNLDVSVLQVLIMEKHLDIGGIQREQETHLTYTREEIFALESVDSGSHQLAFFLNPTKVEEVTRVAGGGERMPQKSTFFHPKLVTGLVINPLPEV